MKDASPPAKQLVAGTKIGLPMRFPGDVSVRLHLLNFVGIYAIVQRQAQMSAAGIYEIQQEHESA